MYWLSDSFYTLFDESERHPSLPTSARAFADVVIVGSGYGGSIAALKLARAFQGSARRVVVLERGKEYLPGEFPDDIDELPSHVHVRNPRARRGIGYADGLFQVLPADANGSGQVSVIVASALGGGSQINANVAKEPDASVFFHGCWPHPFRDAGLSVLHPHYVAVRSMLGAAPVPVEQEPSKHGALKRLYAQFAQPGRLPPGYCASFESPDLAVNFQPALNPAGIYQESCTSCGNCCSGCNIGAKNTLTMNYLPLARQAGARLVTGADVRLLERNPETGEFELEVHPTQAFDSTDEDRCLFLRARIVILAAGSLGTTEVLLRSSALREHLSDRVGEGFSTNGDSICARYDTERDVHAFGLGLAAGQVPQSQRPGPTITGAIRIVPERYEAGQSQAPLPSMTIEDCAVPLPIAGVGAELIGTAAVLRDMQAAFYSRTNGRSEDNLGSSQSAVDRSEVYLTMARDSANGHIVLDDVGGLRVSWPDTNIVGKESAQNDPSLLLLDKLLAAASGQGGVYIPNPIREPLPKEMSSVMSNMPKAGLVTVHPLGGCCMADSVMTGVVDHRGRVFDKKSSGVIEGLYVLDGSVVPCALETNPFLTISALADRAADLLIEKDLDHLLSPGPANGALVRPIQEAKNLLKKPQIDRLKSAAKITPTVLLFQERLRSKVSSIEGLEGLLPVGQAIAISEADFSNGRVYLQLDLEYSPDNLQDFLASAQHACPIRGQLSLQRRLLSIPPYGEKDWEAICPPLTIEDGSIALFHELTPASPLGGMRAFGVYWMRRLKRESRLAGASKFGLKDVLPTLRFLSHISSRRAVSYQFSTRSGSTRLQWKGRKDVSYRFDSNVWNDLFRLPLSATDDLGKRQWSGRLDVDLGYFLGEGAPQVVQQQSLPHAMIDLARYLLLYLRVIGQTYFYEFGPPDYPLRKEPPMTLPGSLTVGGKIVSAQCYWLPVQEYAAIATNSNREQGKQFEHRLGHLHERAYASAPSDSSQTLVCVYQTSLEPKGAVVLLHGYAISSSMWTSPLISQNFVQSLLAAGYDAYVADLRTSAAMPDSSVQMIGFDEVAGQDIPCIVEFTVQKNFMRRKASLRKTQSVEKIRLVAHCMGSAQFAMSILRQARDTPSSSFESTAKHIAQACFFQVSPLLAVTPANASRGKAAALFDTFVGNQMVSPWLSEADKTGAALAFMNRVAMTFPFQEDRDPGWPHQRLSSPWVGVMRKAFWLYGETWDNANIGSALRSQIHDMIGPVNLTTYRQVGQFVRQGRVVTANGESDLVSDEFLLAAYGQFDSLWLHGERSGMFDRQTTAGMAARLRELFRGTFAAQRQVEFQSLRDFGHLDSIIGEDAHRYGHQHVIDFFEGRFDGANTATELAPYAPSDLVDRRQTIRPANWAAIACAASCGPFVSVSDGAQIRIWFFGEAVVRAATPSAFLVAVRAQDVHPVWGVWLQCNESIADLQQYVFQFPRSAVDDGLRLVVGTLPDPMLSRGHGNLMDAQELLWLHEVLPNMLEQDSVVDIPARPLTQAQGGAFMFGSCRYPGLLLDKQLSQQAFDGWATLLGPAHGIDAIVFGGDQVYVDALGNAAGASSHVDVLAQMYRDAFGAPRSKNKSTAGRGLTSLLRSLYLHCVVDDHEFRDNYSASSAMPERARQDAFHAMSLFQGPAMPCYWYRGPRAGLPAPCQSLTLSGSTRLAGCDAFLLDTRLGRNRGKNTLVDEAGWLALEEWAARVDKKLPKFLLTGSVLLPIKLDTLVQAASAITDDSFNGYPQDRDRLLALIWKYQLDNLVLLSGDFHLSCAGRAWLHPPGSVSQQEASLSLGFCVSSGLYAPLTFANLHTWELPESFVHHRITSSLASIPTLDFVVESVTAKQSMAKIEVQRVAGKLVVSTSFYATDASLIDRRDLL